MKIIIIGNSGSGKTWLATRLSSLFDTPIVHLDDLFWEPGGFDKKRNPEEVDLLIQRSKGNGSWITEGVFGELASEYLNAAELFVWLDMDWPTCKQRLENRGSESTKYLGREQSKEELKKLVLWASRYHKRQDLRSYAGHEILFDKFTGSKIRLKTEAEVNEFVENTQQTPLWN